MKIPQDDITDALELSEKLSKAMDEIFSGNQMKLCLAAINLTLFSTLYEISGSYKELKENIDTVNTILTALAEKHHE